MTTSEVRTYLQQIIPNNHSRAAILQQLSHIVNGTPRERKLWILQGSGNNGKSTFLNLIKSTLNGNGDNDDMCVTVSADILCKQNPTDMGCLVNKKLVIINEDDLSTINYCRLKQLMSNDPFIWRKLYHAESTAIPEFDIILTTNTQVTSTRRIEVILFETVFVDNPDPSQPHEMKRLDTLGNLSPSFRTILSNICEFI
jgi:phage/plasmid-associated DNA primase